MERVASWQFDDTGLYGARRAAIGKYALVLMLAAAATFALAHGRTYPILGGALFLMLVVAAAAVIVLWPLLDPDMIDRPMAELVAFVGCDGSGKSTLSTDMLSELAQSRPVALCYLGLGSGAIGERIRRLPVIGPAFESRLAKKAAQARSGDRKIPGLPTAIVIYVFSLVRLRRFRRMLAVRRSGVPVITDRYPQTEVAGFYDGPGLSAARAGNRLIAFLARRELRMYQWMASFQPDVIIRLNVDLDTAHARKPDHTYDLLREKVRVTPLLRFSGAPIRDLDAGQPYETVRSCARLLIGDVLDRRQRIAA